MKHFNIKIYGLVQGVFFRAEAKEQADKLNITGFAKNLPYGSVYIEAEGEKKDLGQFLKWCYKGPNMAQVEKVIISEDKTKNFMQFKIY